VLGSYLIVLTLDWFLIGSGVQQMVLNSIRKSAVPGFTGAYVTVPYQIAGYCFVMANLRRFSVQQYGWPAMMVSAVTLTGGAGFSTWVGGMKLMHNQFSEFEKKTRRI